MKFQWSKSGSVLSKTIRWGLNEPVSHFSFSFDNFLVIHFDLLGIEIHGRNKFLNKHEIIFEIDPGYTQAEEEELYYKIVKNYDDRDYDYKAFAYFGYRIFLYKLLCEPIPKTNPYNDGKALICVEEAGLLPNWDELTIDNPIDLSITSPYRLYQYMIPIFGKGG